MRYLLTGVINMVSCNFSVFNFFTKKLLLPFTDDIGRTDSLGDKRLWKNCFRIRYFGVS